MAINYGFIKRVKYHRNKMYLRAHLNRSNVSAKVFLWQHFKAECRKGRENLMWFMSDRIVCINNALELLLNAKDKLVFINIKLRTLQHIFPLNKYTNRQQTGQIALCAKNMFLCSTWLCSHWKASVFAGCILQIAKTFVNVSALVWWARVNRQTGSRTLVLAVTPSPVALELGYLCCFFFFMFAHRAKLTIYSTNMQ